jgi:hypothetical protein
MGAIGHADHLWAWSTQEVRETWTYVPCTLLMLRSSPLSSGYVVLLIACECHVNYDLNAVVLIDTFLSLLILFKFLVCQIVCKLFSVNSTYILNMLWPRLSVVFMIAEISILTFHSCSPQAVCEYVR